MSAVINEFWLILNDSKVVQDIKTKFLPVNVLKSVQLSTKVGVSGCTQNGIPAKTYFKLQEGMADTFFETHPQNCGNLLLFWRFTNHITIIF